MNYGPELLLVAAVATVGVLHTIVPDHWVPITLIARQRGWSKSETARAALQAGTGHVLSTLLIALVVWLAGVAFAQRFGHIVDTVSSLALIAFGGWFAISAWRDLRTHGGHGHSHSHDFPHLHGNDQGAHPSLRPWTGVAAHRHGRRRPRTIDLRDGCPASLPAVRPNGRHRHGSNSSGRGRAPRLQVCESWNLLGIGRADSGAPRVCRVGHHRSRRSCAPL